MRIRARVAWLDSVKAEGPGFIAGRWLTTCGSRLRLRHALGHGSMASTVAKACVISAICESVSLPRRRTKRCWTTDRT